MRQRRGILLLSPLLLWAAWHLLGYWVLAGGERFLFLTPPVFLAGWLLVAPQGWREVRPHLKPLALLWAILLLTIAALSLMMSWQVDQSTHLFRWDECLIGSYFLLAFLLWLGAAWWLLGRLLLRANKLVRRSDAADSPWLERHVPALVVTLLAVPALLAAINVHRCKLPNTVTPLTGCQRAYEDVVFYSPDSATLQGWWIPARQPTPRTLLVCHGLSNCRANMLGWLPLADELQANLFLFDLRGHGDSSGHTVTFGYLERHDVCAAVDYLRTHKTAESRVLIGAGVSMGAASLIGGAALLDQPFDALVLDSSFASVHGVAENLVGGLPLAARQAIAATGIPASSLLTGCPLDQARPIDWIADVRAPVLIIHARDDRLIPVEHARQLFARAAQPKELWLTPGGHCGAAADTHAYFARVREMVAATVTSALRAQASPSAPERKQPQ